MFRRIVNKDLNEVNMLVRWGLMIGLAFFCIMIYLIWLIEFDIFRNKNIVTDTHLRVALLIFALIISVIVVNCFIRFLALSLNNSYHKRFSHVDRIGSFVEAMERTFFSEKRYDHIVLFLHGFTASPQEFQHIIPYLQSNNINYYMPNIMGFGIDNTALLNNTHRYDWYRTCLGIFDALSKVSNKVSIVGHSMGSMLATYISEHRNVHHLVLTGPGFYSIKSDIKYKILLTTPVISTIYAWIVPYLPKPIRKGRKTTSDTLDNTHTANIFQYLAVPIRSVREVFLLQDEVQPECAHPHSFSIIYGKHELTVDVGRLIQHLNYHGVKYNLFEMENSAHNVLEDFDRDECCQLIIDILLGNKCD